MNFYTIATAAEDLAHVVTEAGTRLRGYEAHPDAQIRDDGLFIGYHLVSHLQAGIESVEDADMVAGRLLESLDDARLVSDDLLPRLAGKWPNGVTYYLFIGTGVKVPAA